MQTVVRFQRIGDPDDGISRETLIAVRAVQLQADRVFRVENQCPQPLEEKVRAGVQVVVTLVGGHTVVLAV